jgi:hypothetical protein
MTCTFEPGFLPCDSSSLPRLIFQLFTWECCCVCGLSLVDIHTHTQTYRNDDYSTYIVLCNHHRVCVCNTLQKRGIQIMKKKGMDWKNDQIDLQNIWFFGKFNVWSLLFSQVNSWLSLFRFSSFWYSFFVVVVWMRNDDERSMCICFPWHTHTHISF